MEDRIVKTITQSNTLLNDDFNLRLDSSASEILSHASLHHPGQDPLPNLDLYMDQPAQLLSSSSVLQHIPSLPQTGTKPPQDATKILYRSQWCLKTLRSLNRQGMPTTRYQWCPLPIRHLHNKC